MTKIVTFKCNLCGVEHTDAMCYTAFANTKQGIVCVRHMGANADIHVCTSCTKAQVAIASEDKHDPL